MISPATKTLGRATSISRSSTPSNTTPPAEEIARASPCTPVNVSRTKGPRYTPVSKRQDKPDGIAWILRNHPEISDAQIGKLIGTTRNTIAAIRDGDAPGRAAVLATARHLKRDLAALNSVPLVVCVEVMGTHHDFGY